MSQERLTRSASGAVIGGICGGLGKYLNTDPIVFRILFVITALVGGGGLLAYIILWIVMPLERDPLTNNPTMNNESIPQSPVPEDTGEQKKKARHHGGNLWGGLILITLGAIFLIDRFVPRVDFGDLWPLILIAIGIILIFEGKTRPKS
ncbi:MAG: PspC domain-containing protein [Bacteroidales bacterium]|nr:PspC domain-containing protein [Bacteroidales bacterium]